MISLTNNHFTSINFDTYVPSENDSVSENDKNQDSDSDSDSESDYETDSGNGSESESNNSGSGTETESESESEIDTDEPIIDEDDLFNTKTNGNEFYGDVLNNRYLIIKKLGYGAFSSVWMAYDVDDNKLVAIKIINPSDYKEGMLEIKTYKRLDNLDTTYLLTMLNCFEVVPIHYKYYSEEYKEKHKVNRNHLVIILPLMACSTFDLLKCSEYEDGLPLDIAVKIVEQTLLGIKELEKNNLMHTDLKPENILTCGLNREAELLLKTIQDINIKNVHRQQLDKIESNDKWDTSYKLYKEITRTIIKFIKNDMVDIKKQMKICKVSSKYIKDIQIKICDFNLVIIADENIDNIVEIQTRYYRAPEILMKHGLHSKTDYWSIGCILFELLTGDILFDPEKDKDYSRNIHHMYLIEELIGPVPKHMIVDCDLYDEKGYLKGIGKKIKKWDLENVLNENYNNLGLNQEQIEKITKFINSILQINPDNRPNIKTMLSTIKLLK